MSKAIWLVLQKFEGEKKWYVFRNWYDTKREAEEAANEVGSFHDNPPCVNKIVKYVQIEKVGKR